MLVILKSPRDQEPNVSIVPGGTDISLLHHFPALRTGLLSLSPSGTSLQRILLTPYVDADGRCLMFQPWEGCATGLKIRQRLDS
jgi:hypothetical protein